MLFINKASTRILRAKENHVNYIRCYLRRKALGQKCNVTSCKACKGRCDQLNDVPLALQAVIRDDFFLDQIIQGNPDDLSAMSEMVWYQLVPSFSWSDYDLFFKAKGKKEENRSQLEQEAYDRYYELHSLLLKIFDYDVWFQNKNDSKRYDAYQLAENLDRATCTYCNRLYTSTMKTRRGKKVMRTTFDHWHSHARHPLLGLSFFNLIPSCSTCNSSVKGFKEYLTSTHLHPYIDEDCADQFRYSYDFFRETDRLEIKIVAEPGNSKAFNTYNDMKLREMYNAHHAELRDLLRIKDAYSVSYIDSMKRAYAHAGLSNKEIYRLAFGVELDSHNFYKRPLSKFKKDILSELKMLDFE